MLAGRELRKIAETMPELAIEEVDIVTHPRRAWQDGVRMIPSMKIGDRSLSGIFLSGADIARFIEEEKRQSG